MVQIEKLVEVCRTSVYPGSGDTNYWEMWDTEYRARIPVFVPA